MIFITYLFIIFFNSTLLKLKTTDTGFIPSSKDTGILKKKKKGRAKSFYISYWITNRIVVSLPAHCGWYLVRVTGTFTLSVTRCKIVSYSSHKLFIKLRRRGIYFYMHLNRQQPRFTFAVQFSC